ncbi:hypothetical protein [Secundilactobacillus collinoides]|uniref:hypothetical protein n=1 Tax=Secundilactobacillus collinoides TaxID=33960 RepID=UPI000A7672EE|nr:hypothetical protein [Secundilactobacillus collinoides]
MKTTSCLIALRLHRNKLKKRLKRYLNKIKRQKWVEEEISAIPPQTLGFVERQQNFSSINAEQEYWRQHIVEKKYHEQIKQINSGAFVDIVAIAISFFEKFIEIKTDN